ncbi:MULTISPECIES: hypothetical protein [unclassified Knoellia]|uniref:hypothetical protein n=1 Tax=Knoellia altitudinis TaxID=3404795 RepID=UPI003605CC9D
MDTRTGNGAPKGVVGAGKELSILVAGRGDVPSGVSAVVLNLTAVAPSTNTFLTVYPSGTPRPATSNLNVAARTNRANMVTIPVGSDGRVRIYNSSGTTHILADVTGYYHGLPTATPASRPSTYVNLGPTRLYDSRSGDGAFAPGDSTRIGIDYGVSDADNTRITALAVNVTVTGGTGPGYIGNVYNSDTSILNYAANQSVANMTVQAAQYYGSNAADGVGFELVNRGPGTVHVIVDLVGVYDDSSDYLRFRPLAPQRIMDTRSGIGGPSKPLSAGEARLQTAPDTVAGWETYALVANTTVANPTANTYLTLYAGGLERPDVSNLNVPKGATGANSTFIDLDDAFEYRVHNAAGSSPTIVDAFGTFDLNVSMHSDALADAPRAERGRTASDRLDEKRAATEAAARAS